MQKAVNLNDVAIVPVKGKDYRIHFWYTSKNNAINITKNSNSNEKNWITINVFIIYKNEWNNLLYKNGEIILNIAKDYFKNNKEVLREQAKNKYRKLSEEEKNIKDRLWRNRYHNMSEEKEKKDYRNIKNLSWR